jgi:hypothetical protein
VRAAEIILTSVLVGFRRRRKRRIGCRTFGVCVGLFPSGRVYTKASAIGRAKGNDSDTLPDLISLAVEMSFFTVSGRAAALAIVRMTCAA